MEAMIQIDFLLLGERSYFFEPDPGSVVVPDNAPSMAVDQVAAPAEAATAAATATTAAAAPVAPVAPQRRQGGVPEAAQSQAVRTIVIDVAPPTPIVDPPWRRKPSDQLSSTPVVAPPAVTLTTANAAEAQATSAATVAEAPSATGGAGHAESQAAPAAAGTLNPSAKADKEQEQVVVLDGLAAPTAHAMDTTNNNVAANNEVMEVPDDEDDFDDMGDLPEASSDPYLLAVDLDDV